MLWKIVLALAQLAEKVIERLVPTRKEASIEQYRVTAKDILKRQDTRNEKRNKAGNVPTDSLGPR